MSANNCPPTVLLRLDTRVLPGFFRCRPKLPCQGGNNVLLDTRLLERSPSNSNEWSSVESGVTPSSFPCELCSRRVSKATSDKTALVTLRGWPCREQLTN